MKKYGNKHPYSQKWWREHFPQMWDYEDGYIYIDEMPVFFSMN